MKIAYNQRLLFYKNPSRTVIIDADLVYYKEAWTTGRTMGEAKSHASRMRREGVGFEKGNIVKWSNEIYDIRIVPPDAAEVIQDFDNQIAELQKQRQEFIDNNMRTWTIPTEVDCTKTITGDTKEQAQAKVREANKTPLSDNTVKQERRMVNNINDAFRKL